MTKTLLVDGNNLFKIGYHGVKEFYHEGKHIGGLYHFVNTLRKFISEYNYDKVIVFWDGENNSSQRRFFYPRYKENRRLQMNEHQKSSYDWQRQRVKQYLEDMFVRQVDIENTESDDLIAYYCQISINEHKTIFSGDNDLTQLISDNVDVYQPTTKLLLKKGDKIKLKEIEIPHYNIVTYKIVSGDRGDNIDGIYLLGEKTMSKLFPEILENVVTVSDILKKAEQIHLTDKNNKAVQNILTGKTKKGVFGEEFFTVNTKIVDLSNPLITEDGKRLIENYYDEDMDPEGRGYKNLMRMMIEDGFFKYLPKQDDAWVNFLTPFMKLTRKEKRRFNTKK
jgi:5'-3' exonuclease